MRIDFIACNDVFAKSLGAKSIDARRHARSVVAALCHAAFTCAFGRAIAMFGEQFCEIVDELTRRIVLHTTIVGGRYRRGHGGMELGSSK